MRSRRQVFMEGKIREYNFKVSCARNCVIWYRIWYHLVSFKSWRFDNTKCVINLIKCPACALPLVGGDIFDNQALLEDAFLKISSLRGGRAFNTICYRRLEDALRNTCTRVLRQNDLQYLFHVLKYCRNWKLDHPQSIIKGMHTVQVLVQVPNWYSEMKLETMLGVDCALGERIMQLCGAFIIVIT